jgi:1-pyrroline-4-hydroxy-2-carboxylate deaminase
MKSLTWNGIYSAMLTPLTNTDTIDYDMLNHNINIQIDAGVHGLIFGGSLGEASTLSFDERNEILVKAKACAQERVPVLINIAEQTVRDAIKVAHHAEMNGADGLMLLPPMRYKSDEAETLHYFLTVAENTSLPLMIYNNPYDYKIEVTLKMFDILAKNPKIQAIKESTRDTSNVTRLRNHFSDRFKILCGVDTLAIEELALSADGWVGGLVDAFPHETVAIFTLMKAGNYAAALKIFQWFFPLLELDIHPKFVQYIKLAASINGMCNEEVRAPRMKLTGTERDEILAVIHKALNKRHEILPFLQEHALLDS